jgi:hypothetical protein
MSAVLLTIGGKSVLLPPINFAAIEAAWPAIEGFKAASTLVAQTSLVIEMVSHIFVQAEPPAPEMTPQAIKKQLKGNELVDLVRMVPDILSEMGLVQTGEAKPAGENLGSNSSES